MSETVKASTAEQIRREKNAYFRNWRKNNPEKVKAINERYWRKRIMMNSAAETEKQ